MVDETSLTAVRVMLDHIGLRPTAAEVEQLAAAYPDTRLMMAALDALPGMRDEEPSLIFSAKMYVS
jgi:hypothetical protein